ncbi:tetratricopeptide repeat protein [Urbifossiella limnaea]|uniref:Tetratricopeptide repeat protein n=1 Tax=Urbifossiella limnaea TaxID=2528023 RepID=A0A517XR61_9BACT|nr:tetratricopeptide repeat protein [Urbifossiella limnaea]QDU19984.1 Tetratricopeptide repeat protein [Urbifossiella limnaea]
MRRVLSLNRLGILLGVLVVVVASAVGVHAVQTERQAAVLKTRAEKAEQEGAADPERLADAATYYKQYLKYRKTDEEAFTRYASLQQARAKTDNKHTEAAAQAVEEFLRQFPHHADDRRAVVDLYLKLGKPANALSHIEILLATPAGKDDPDLLDKAATCELAENDFARAVERLDRAVSATPHRAKPEIVARLLGLLNSNKNYANPERTPERYVGILLDDEPYRDDVKARVLAARYLLLKGNVKAARKEAEHALTLKDGLTSAEARMAMAEMEMADLRGKPPEGIAEQLKKAEDQLWMAVKSEPKNVAAGIMLSQILADQAQRGKAIDVLRAAADALGETNDQYLLVVDRLLDLGELDQSAKLTEKLGLNEADRERIVKYLNGRRLVVKGDFAAARPLLEDVAPLLARVPDFQKKALTGLGQCYESLQNPDRALASFSDALKLDAAYLPAIVGQAEALLRLGRVRDALPQYRTIVTGYKLTMFRPQLARLEMRAVIAQPPASRNWADFDKAVGPPPRDFQTELLVADSLIARNERGKAVVLLNELLNKDRKNAAAWVALARARAPESPDALGKTLVEAEKEVGDTVELRLAKVLGAMFRGRRPTVDELRVALAGAEKFSPADQNRLLRGVGEASARLAGVAPELEAKPLNEFALECYERAAAVDRTDLLSRMVLVDLGQLLNKPDAISRALAGLAAVEGENGPIGTLGRVIIELPKVRDIADRTTRALAAQRLRAQAVAARTVRPGWGRVYVILARIDEMEGLTDSALANFQAAIERGERDEYVVRRAVDLLRDKKLDDLAAGLLNGLAAEVPLPEDLERFRTVQNLLNRDIAGTERSTIDRIAPGTHNDWRVLLLRGQLLAATGQDEDALKAFRDAVFYGVAIPEAWGALVAHQARLGRTDDARKSIADAEALLAKSAPPDAAKRAELIDTLAMCHELVGDLPTAEQRYAQAVAAAPQELNPIRQQVLFLQRSGKGAAAEAMLRRLDTGPAGDAARWARRHLALTMLAGGDSYQYRNEALALIEKNVKSDAAAAPDAEDIKTKAMVQTVDPRTQAEGMQKLNEYARWGNLTPDEFVHLGKLYFDQGKVFQSVEFFEKATRSRAGVNPEHLAVLTRVYLSTNDVARAKQSVARLKAIAPRSWAAAREDARVLAREATAADKAARPDVATKARADAKARVLDFPGATARDFVVTQSGPLLQELGFFPEAETLYTRLQKESPDSPAAVAGLAQFWIGRKRTDEALRLVKEFADKGPPVLVAQLMTGAVRAKSPGSAAEREVEAWLDARLTKTADPFEQLALLGAKAELLDAQRKYDEAIGVYDTVLARAKALPPAEQKRYPVDTYKNNLAMLLALHRPRDADRAIALMTEVITARGPRPAYLDTRAVAYLVKGGRTNDAVDDLNLALMQQQSAVYLFHLGWAMDQDPVTRGRRDAPLAEAKQLGLTAEDLHPLEARKFAELYLPR